MERTRYLLFVYITQSVLLLCLSVDASFEWRIHTTAASLLSVRRVIATHACAVRTCSAEVFAVCPVRHMAKTATQQSASASSLVTAWCVRAFRLLPQGWVLLPPASFISVSVSPFFFSEGLQKNYWPHFHETWGKDEAWEEPVTFWDRSKWQTQIHFHQAPSSRKNKQLRYQHVVCWPLGVFSS